MASSCYDKPDGNCVQCEWDGSTWNPIKGSCLPDNAVDCNVVGNPGGPGTPIGTKKVCLCEPV